MAMLRINFPARALFRNESLSGAALPEQVFRFSGEGRQTVDLAFFRAFVRWQ
ncbi:MAG: hypothetical protein ACK40A_12220 [Pannonibacter indicus]